MHALSSRPTLQGRNLLGITDLTSAEINALLRLSVYLKQRRPIEQLPLLRGKTLTMLFEKPSLRTRVSFEVAMTQLGGQVVFADGKEFMIGSRETPEDASCPVTLR